MTIKINSAVNVGPVNSDRNFIFESTNDDTDLKNRSIKSGTITLIAQGIKLILQIGSAAILARLLTPQDFGLVAMVSAIFAFVQLFGDMGLSAATIQRSEICHAQVSTLFWINALLGVGLMLGCVAISPLLSWFYGEPRVACITIILSVNFMFGGLKSQHQAILTRQMRFGSIAFIEISSSFLGIMTAIALTSYGYWALVAMSLVSSISATIGVWISCKWIPGLPVRGSGVRSMLFFGGNLTGMSLLNYFARNLDNVLIGRFCGPVQLGFYARAYNLFMMPMRQVTYPIASVAMPVLSKLQNDGERFKKYYLSAVSVIALIAMPLSVFLFVMADEVILILLGQQWFKSIEIFRLLAVSLLFQPIYSTGNWLYVAIGRSDLLFKYGTLGSLFIAISFLIGLPFGPRGVAFFYSACIALWTGPSLYFATLFVPINFKSIIKEISPIFISSLISGVIIYIVKCAMNQSHSVFASLVICFLLMTSVYMYLVFHVFSSKNTLFILWSLKK